MRAFVAIHVTSKKASRDCEYHERAEIVIFGLPAQGRRSSVGGKSKFSAHIGIRFGSLAEKNVLGRPFTLFHTCLQDGQALQNALFEQSFRIFVHSTWQET